MDILAIDPGPIHSGLVRLDPQGNVLQACVLRNDLVLGVLAAEEPASATRLAIEWISSFGMPVGSEIFETCRWVGRFQQTWHAPDNVLLIPRAEIKLALCHSSRAKDVNVRQALIDLYQPTGGGNCPQVGTARKPGPLHKVHSHSWSALAVGVVASARLARDGHQAPAAFMGPTALERLT